MLYKFYSYSLVETKQENLGLYPKTVDKPSLFKQVLTEKVSEDVFHYNGSTLGFLVNKTVGNYLLCAMGKKMVSTIVHSPKEKFKEETKEDWKRCNIYFSLDPKAQYLAFEYKTSIFSDPFNQLNALASEINSFLLDQSYEIVFSPVLKEDMFWDVIDIYQNNIQKVQFDYIAPNFLNTKTRIHDGLKEAKKKFGITNLSLVFENKEGHLTVPTDDNHFRENVEEATKGGGSIKVKAKGKTVYSSDKNKNVKATDIDIDLELNSNDDVTIEKAIDRIFSCLD